MARIPDADLETCPVPESLAIIPAPLHVELGSGRGLDLGPGVGLLVGSSAAEIALGVYGVEEHPCRIVR